MAEVKIQRNRSNRTPPVWIKASEVQELTIWDNKAKMQRARLQGNLQLIRRNGQIYYNANHINPIFFKNKP